MVIPQSLGILAMGIPMKMDLLFPSRKGPKDWELFPTLDHRTYTYLVAHPSY